MLVRDVDNLHRFLSRFVPGAKSLPLGEEMWELYEASVLTPTTELTGTFVATVLIFAMAFFVRDARE